MTDKLVPKILLGCIIIMLSGCDDTGYAVPDLMESNASKEHEKNIIMDEPQIAHQNQVSKSDGQLPKNPPEPLQNDVVMSPVQPPASTSENKVPEPVVQPQH